MARQKEFDRDVALAEAIKVFASHGYEGASTETLLGRMGISRQSMYDTFGDKRRLYLDALQQYVSSSTAEIIATMHSAPSPVKGLEAALMNIVSRQASEPFEGCLGVSAVCEYGRSDREVSTMTDASGATLLSAFEGVIVKGRAAGEIAADVDVKATAQFMRTLLSGLKVSARAGATPESLRKIVRVALRSLR
jgi:TetR/AcrR family transcriptional regulator, transcriptional repressor for nem operon